MGSSPSLPPKKQRFYDSATEESVPPPKKPTTKTNQPEQQQVRSSRLLPRLLTPANPGEGQRSRIRMPPILWWVGGYPSGYKMLMPYGAKTRDKLSYALLTMHWIFDTADAEYGKGRTFMGSSG